MVERTKAGPETDGIETVSCITSRRVCTVGVVEWLKSCCPAKPEGAERTENYEGKGVANDPLSGVSIERDVDHDSELTSPMEPRIIRSPPKK